MKRIRRFLKDQAGLETIEWTLMAAIIVLGVILLYTPVKIAITAIFDALAAKLNEAAAG